MKYYTYTKACKKANNGELAFMKQTNFGFSYGLYNVIRMYFGMQPKQYYFVDEHNPLKHERESGYKPLDLEKMMDDYYRKRREQVRR